MAKYWYKNAVVYSLHVESFMDSNADGIGDFKGLTQCIDYLAGLGVNCVWLLPFYPSPYKDHGYDITNYMDVDPKYGNLGHFVEFIDEAEERGIKVLIDLVVNHTSIDHPWFQAARKDKNSKYYKYFIWTDELPANNPTKTAFGHEADGQWAWDDEAQQYYFHTFYEHQADLNLTNPDVQEEIKYIIHFWIKLGIAGFRMDAVHQMLNKKGNEEWNGDPHDFLREIRSFVEHHRPDGVLLAEVDVEPEKYKDFFGDSDQLQILFNFYLNSRLFLALSRGDSQPIKEGLNALPKLSLDEQFGTFVRNHDELNLERLKKKEQQEVFNQFGPDENMQVYGRGIRRRLASMLGNHRPKMELMYSLMFSLPGTPIFRYGQEIGMGEDLNLKERNSVRTAMQWSDQKHGGFSKSEKNKLKVPVISGGDYGFEKVNVFSQMRDPKSLLNWIERIISVRKECVEFGFGEYQFIDSHEAGLLVHFCSWKGGISLAIHNLTEKELNVKLDLTDEKFSNLIEIFGDQPYKSVDLNSKKINLAPFGYRWFRKSTLFL